MNVEDLKKELSKITVLERFDAGIYCIRCCRVYPCGLVSFYDKKSKKELFVHSPYLRWAYSLREIGYESNLNLKKYYVY
jgi:hypothetical protein